MLNQSKLLLLQATRYVPPMIIMFAYFVVTAGNINLGISQASSDDGIISHAISFANPELFINDSRANSFRIETPTSIMNLLPALSYQFFSINLTYFWVIFLFLQTVLFPLAIFGIVQTLEPDKYKAAIVTVLFLNLRPQTRNLSYSGDLDWMPYAMWLAESFLVFSILLYLKKQRNKSYLFLTISCLIHPSLGVWIFLFFLIADFYILNKSGHLKQKSWNVPLFSMVTITIFLLSNYIYLNNELYSFPTKDYLSSVFENRHFNSISMFSNEFEVYAIVNSSIIMLVGIILYVIFSSDKLKDSSWSWLLRFVYSACFVSLVGVLIQIFGLLTENITLVRLMGTRFTSVLSILIFIVFLLLLFKEKLDSKTKIVLSITFLFFPGAATIFLIAIFKAFKNWKLVSSKMKTVVLIFVTISIVSSFRLASYVFSQLIENQAGTYLLTLENTNLVIRNFFLTFLPYEMQIFFYVIVLFSTLAFHKSSHRNKPVLNVDENKKLIASILILLLLTGKFVNTNSRFDSQDKNFMQVQKWAKQNSEASSSFLVLVETTYNGWRNYAQRPKITLEADYSPYGFYKSNVAISERLKKVLQKHSNINLQHPSESLLMDLSYSLRLDYIVTSIKNDAYSFEIAYENSDYRIYRINH